jgi:pilus assembly protein CpaD
MLRHWTTMLVLALPLMACVPGAAEYTKAEAPAALRVYGSQTAMSVSFAAGSARLAAGQAAGLARLVHNGAVGPADRVEIAAAGSDPLARARVAAISRILLAYGIVATPRPLAGVSANRAVLLVGHYAVMLPPCPDWSQTAHEDFTNESSSNYGCANAINLGMTVANPADLANGRTLEAKNGEPAVSSVQRYLTDKVIVPQLATISLTSTPTTGSGSAPTTTGTP